MPLFIMRAYATCALLFLAAACASAPTTPSPPADPLGDAVRAYLQPVADMNDFSGVVRIEKDGKLLTEQRFGYADWPAHAPHEPDTRFGAGSITKSMTASLVVILEEKGLLDHDARLSAFFPDYAHGDEMTVAQVLDHTAGLPRDAPANAQDAPDGFDLIAWLNAQPLLSAPGEKYSYSNIGYDLLAMICEKATGERFAALADKHLFKPLGLSDSSIETRIKDAPHAAKGYQPGPLLLDIQPADFPAAISPGADGLAATPADLIAWARAVMNRSVANLFQEDGSMIGSVKVHEQEDRTVYRLQGTTPGYGAAVIMVPDDALYIAFASNLQTYPLFGLEWVLLDIAEGEAPGPAPLRKPTTALTDDHRRLIGAYMHPRFGPIRIEEHENGLHLVLLGPGWDFYLSPTADGEVVFRFFNTRIFRDPDGAVKAEQALLGQDAETFELAPLAE